MNHSLENHFHFLLHVYPEVCNKTIWCHYQRDHPPSVTTSDQIPSKDQINRSWSILCMVTPQPPAAPKYILRTPVEMDLMCHCALWDCPVTDLSWNWYLIFPGTMDNVIWYFQSTKIPHKYIAFLLVSFVNTTSVTAKYFQDIIGWFVSSISLFTFI